MNAKNIISLAQATPRWLRIPRKRWDLNPDPKPASAVCALSGSRIRGRPFRRPFSHLSHGAGSSGISSSITAVRAAARWGSILYAYRIQQCIPPDALYALRRSAEKGDSYEMEKPEGNPGCLQKAMIRGGDDFPLLDQFVRDRDLSAANWARSAHTCRSVRTSWANNLRVEFMAGCSCWL